MIGRFGCRKLLQHKSVVTIFYLTMTLLRDKLIQGQFFHGGICQNSWIWRLSTTVDHGGLQHRQEQAKNEGERRLNASGQAITQWEGNQHFSKMNVCQWQEVGDKSEKMNGEMFEISQIRTFSIGSHWCSSSFKIVTGYLVVSKLYNLSPFM